MNIVNDYKNIALSGREILDLVDGEANIITYPNLKKYRSIDELLYPYGACFILYESKKNFGHWCCLIKRGNEIEFFNPYGGFPDDDLDLIPPHYRQISGQNYPLLSYLMDISPYRLAYNEHKFQKYGKNIQTCGRWCSLRILLKEYPLEDFAKIFKGKYGDDLATILTMWVNKKSNG